MTPFERLGLRALHRLDPEQAHGLSLLALRARLAPLPGPVTGTRLGTTLAGLEMPNPVGLAAGYDKNAVALAPLSRAGFGFLEVGAATPRPQPGNPKPRLFRLTEDRAAINRFGFNNDGAAAISRRLAEGQVGIPVGLNLGANKDSTDRAGDYAAVLSAASAGIDFATVNISSPNTAGLRDLQERAALTELLERVTETNAARSRPVPIFVKIAPDLDHDSLAAIAEATARPGIAGLIATNTTLAREGLKSPHGKEAGGLSGAPLFEPSTRILAQLSTLTDLPIIGVGGVSTAQEAFAKIRAGASAVQLYTALVYGGLSLVGEIARDLDRLLEEEGFANVAEAVGTGRADWL